MKVKKIIITLIVLTLVPISTKLVSAEVKEQNITKEEYTFEGDAVTEKQKEEIIKIMDSQGEVKITVDESSSNDKSMKINALKNAVKTKTTIEDGIEVTTYTYINKGN